MNIKVINLIFRNIKILNPAPIIIILNIILINKIILYSDKKIIANPPLLYSTLNPDTSSDSPSAKSKGARLVSANEEAKRQNLRGKHTIINHKYF